MEDAYVQQLINRIFYKYAIYMVSSVGAYDFSKSVGGNEEEIYPYLSAEGYVEKVITVVKEFYDLSKYPCTVTLPRDYHPDLY